MLFINFLLYAAIYPCADIPSGMSYLSQVSSVIYD